MFVIAAIVACGRPVDDGVIVATGPSALSSPTAAGKVLRERTIDVSKIALTPPHNQMIDLALFDDTVVHAIGIRTEPAGSGFVWIGQLRDQPRSEVILSVQKGSLAGNIITDKGENYEIRPAGEGVHIVRQIDPTTFLDDDINAGPAGEKLGQGPPLADPCGGTDTGESIDVLIAYTAAARAANGGTSGIEALIYGAVARTNQSYRDSAINQRMRIVHLQEVAYTETGNACTDLDRMHNPTDGFLDDVLTARDAYGADIAMLLVDGALVSTTRVSSTGARVDCAGPSNGVFGETYNILNPVTPAFEPNALIVLQASAATGNLTLAHEAGHAMGARHDRASDPTDGSPFTFNHGFDSPACAERSVMATIRSCPSCTRVPLWSNPGTSECSAPFGVAAPASNAADNHAALNATAATVANFRCSSPGRSDVWMRDTWDDTGLEPDPHTAGQDMWKSPYIWVRNAQDTTLVHQHEHQTPGLNSMAWVYVKLHNGGAATSGTLELYWAYSSTGLAWPGTWTLAGTAPVTSFAAASTLVAEIPWMTPPSAPDASGHFCLLARWVSSSDPIVGEGPDITANVRNSNNLVWRNLERLLPMGDGTMDATFVVRNIEPLGGKGDGTPYALRIAPVHDEANGSFFFYGQGMLTLDPVLFQAWQKGGSKGQGFKFLGGTQFLITDPDGLVLDNIGLVGEATGKLDLQRAASTPRRDFAVEATQVVTRNGVSSTVGGVTYELVAPN